MKHMDSETYYLRRLQTLPVNHSAMLCISSKLLKKVKWNDKDTIAESLEGDRIILQRVRMQRDSEDGVVA
jgi:hypothetical protein